MPRESPAVSDDANVDEKNQKKNDVKASKSKGDLESESEGNNEDGDNEEGEEEEYEIEEILQAKKGIFGGGKLAYFVKWKGYGPNDNSWVSEEDAANATELIDKFWKTQNKKGDRKAPRKSIDTPKRPRKSATADGASDEESVSVSKKRARKSQTKEQEPNGPAEQEESRPAKRNKKTKTDADSAARALSAVVLEEEIGNMSAYMNVADWDHLVDRIDTVEQKDGDLFVYFTLTDGNERVVEKSSLCRVKFPQKMLDFYEKNLRWRESNGNDD